MGKSSELKDAADRRETFPRRICAPKAGGKGGYLQLELDFRARFLRCEVPVNLDKSEFQACCTLQLQLTASDGAAAAAARAHELGLRAALANGFSRSII